MTAKFTNTNKSGYTLVEILVATTIFVAVVGIGVATFNAASGFQSKTQAIQETNQAVRFVIEKISRDVRSADGLQQINPVVGAPIKVFGFALLNDQNELRTDTTTSVSRLVVIKKGQGINCDKYNQVILYSVDNHKITQDMHYTDPLIPGLADVNNTACTGGVSSDLLGNRTDLQELIFSGLDPIQTIKQEPYLKIELNVRSLDYDSADSNERAAVDLQTTVVPRLDGFKY